LTIEKGQPWGGPAEDPSPDVVVGSDGELAAKAAEAHQAGAVLVARLTDGDLLTTLGIDGVRVPAERYAYPIDLAFAHVRRGPAESESFPFVAHLTVGPAAAVGQSLALLAGRLLGHGPPITAAVMNGSWLGHYRLGPRAHPNDGLVDVTEGRVRFRERTEAARRARSGAHLPHPEMRTTRTADWSAEFDRPRPVRIDGVDRGSCVSVRVTVVPDGLVVVA
jgi:hypothetical protein